jgi:hypothetical protein
MKKSQRTHQDAKRISLPQEELGEKQTKKE